MAVLTLRQWFKHVSIYGMGILLLNVLSFLLLPIYTHRISPGDYGVLELLNRSRDVLLIVLNCGMGMAALTFYQHEGANPERQRKVFSTAILGIFIAAGSVVLVLSFASQWISVKLLRTPDLGWAVQFALWTGLFELVFQIGLISMQARFRSVSYAILTVGRLVFAVAVNVVLVLWLRWGLKGILFASLLHTLIFALIAVALVSREVGFKFDWSLWQEMFRFGYPFIPGSFFLFILNSGDRYFLEAHRGSTELGIYALGYRFGQIATMGVLTPFLKVYGSAMVEICGRSNGREQVAKIATYLALAYAAVGLGVSLGGPFLLRLFSPSNYWGGNSVISLIVLSYFFFSLSTVADTAFYMTKKTLVKPFIMGAAAVVCLAFYALLIPRFGMMGAAIATLIGFALFAVLTWVIAYHYLPVRYEFGRLIKIVGAASFVYVLGCRVSIGTSWVNVVGSALLWVLFPVLLYLLRFPNVDEIVRLRSLWSAGISRASILAAWSLRTGRTS